MITPESTHFLQKVGAFEFFVEDTLVDIGLAVRSLLQGVHAEVALGIPIVVNLDPPRYGNQHTRFLYYYFGEK